MQHFAYIPIYLRTCEIQPTAANPPHIILFQLTLMILVAIAGIGLLLYYLRRQKVKRPVWLFAISVVMIAGAIAFGALLVLNRPTSQIDDSKYLDTCAGLVR